MPDASSSSGSTLRYLASLVRSALDRYLLLSLGFGVALGLAVASKLSAAPLAILLPGAFLVRYLVVDRKQHAEDNGGELLLNMALPIRITGPASSFTW